MFENVIVKKPWGFEYLVYENDNVGVWYLNIEYGKQTSLHAHPNKKTGLIILSGVAEVSFLNRSTVLTSPGKTMIRHGVFHSTKAISKQGLEVLEIETPKDKTDLIRLEDNYGRAGEPYEDDSHYQGKLLTTLNISQKITLGDCNLHKRNDLCINQYHTYIILNGGVKSNHYPVLSYGDIVDNPTLIRLAEKFEACPSEIIGIEY